MTEVVESYDIIDYWLYQTLSNDATLTAIVGTRISADLSQVNYAFPYLTWDAADTRAVYGIGGQILDTSSIYNVKVVGRGDSYSICAPAVRRVKELIHRQNVTLSTPVSSSLSCHWENEIRYPEVVEGVEHRHLGGAYRILAVAL